MKTTVLLSSALLGLFLAGCGGGGDSAGGGGPTKAVGAISRFGSVFVNGVEFDTRGTQVQMNGNPATEDDLRVGMVVRVDGLVSSNGVTGAAGRILFDHDLEGPVTSVADVAAGRLEVLGQTVLLDDLTVFESVTAATLAVGNIVEVSGFFDADGNLQARHVELKAASFDALAVKEIEVKGEIQGLDAESKTFAIGGLAVGFSAAEIHDGIAALADGLFVEVKSDRALTPAGLLLASRVELEERRIPAEEGLRVELEGLVTAFTSASAFEVNGHPVTTTNVTQFESGAAEDLALNARVEVEGTLDAAGVLAASKVSFRPARNVKVEAEVSAVDPDAGTVTVLGSSPGLMVQVDASTGIRDKRGHDRRFGLASLAVGDRVKVRAVLRDGQILAAKLERDDPREDGRVRLQARVDVDAAGLPLSADPFLQILGIRVDTTNAQFEGGGESPMNRADFFSALGPGVLVKADGVLSADGAILAREVELEGEDEREHQMERAFAFEMESEAR